MEWAPVVEDGEATSEWVAGMKLWLVMGGGDKTMADRGWWCRNYAWSWVVMGVDSKVIAGSGRLHNSVMPLFSKTCKTLYVDGIY